MAIIKSPVKEKRDVNKTVKKLEWGKLEAPEIPEIPWISMETDSIKIDWAQVRSEP